MITECNEDNVHQVFDYIGQDYEKCLYMYIDLVKYGIKNENFKVWIQYDDENNICGIISQYFKGIQIYSKSYNIIPDEMISFIKSRNPDIITGMKEAMLQIKEGFLDYHEVQSNIGRLNELTYPSNPEAYTASVDELEEITELVYEDENLGMIYTFEQLYEQFHSRLQDNFGRNVIVRDEDTNEIVCHAATSAELPELAVITGVITSPDYRGKGYSKGILAAICEQLLSEGKNVFSYFNIPPAVKMHYGVGFEKVGDWVKFKKIS